MPYQRPTPLPRCCQDGGAIEGLREDRSRHSEKQEIGENALRLPEVPRHHQLGCFSSREFDSRRLHHPSLASLARSAVGAVGSQVGFGLRPRRTWSTPAASTNFVLGNQVIQA
jgi:hypothetical protein